MDKPAGITSHDVVAAVRRRFRTRAVGHTGTLDPFATGLLVLVLGSATRLARFVTSEWKSYRAVARLGFATDTDDGTGAPLGTPWSGGWPSRDDVAAALGGFLGSTGQRPPAYSAKQVGGRRSYAVARRGGSLALETVEVVVRDIELLRYEPPVFEWRATVGPGTYLRALARDLGERLGTGAHLTDLRRERVGRFDVADAVALDRLTGEEPLLDPVALVPELVRIELSDDEVASARHGRRVGVATGEVPAALVSGETLVAVGEPRGGRWQPVVVLGG